MPAGRAGRLVADTLAFVELAEGVLREILGKGAISSEVRQMSPHRGPQERYRRSNVPWPRAKRRHASSAPFVALSYASISVVMRLGVESVAAPCFDVLEIVDTAVAQMYSRYQRSNRPSRAAKAFHRLLINGVRQRLQASARLRGLEEA